MNYRLVCKLLSIVCLLIGVTMIFSLPWAWPLLGRRTAEAFNRFEQAGFIGLVASILISLAFSGGLWRIGRKAVPRWGPSTHDSAGWQRRNPSIAPPRSCFPPTLRPTSTWPISGPGPCTMLITPGGIPAAMQQQVEFVPEPHTDWIFVHARASGPLNPCRSSFS
jgi:hypothetical protein